MRVSTQKRPVQLDAEPPAAKRQCGASRKTNKPKPPPATASPPTDPAKLRRKGNAAAELKLDLLLLRLLFEFC